jgi:hypothetical protein
VVKGEAEMIPELIFYDIFEIENVRGKFRIALQFEQPTLSYIVDLYYSEALDSKVFRVRKHIGIELDSSILIHVMSDMARQLAQEVHTSKSGVISHEPNISYGRRTSRPAAEHTKRIAEDALREEPYRLPLS